MPEERRSETFDSAISGDTAGRFTHELKNHDSRMVIKDVVSEYIASSAFATRVKEIQLEALESTETYKKLSDKVGNQIDKTLNDRNLKTKNFVIPLIFSIISAIAAVAAVIVAIVALGHGGR